jgi:hypothetical protein
MEAHAVHYNKKYEDFKEAADKHDGLAVVAFFLKATDDDEHPCFNKMTEAVKKIVKINSITSVPSGSKVEFVCIFFLFFQIYRLFDLDQGRSAVQGLLHLSGLVNHRTLHRKCNLDNLSHSYTRFAGTGNTNLNTEVSLLK